MARRLTKKLHDAVRKLSYRATVDELRERGVERVNVVGLDRIVALIEAAVHRTLKKHMLGLGSIEDRGGIVGETREEFLRLLQSQKEMEKEKEAGDRQREELREQVDDLRLMLHDAQQKLDAEQKQVQRDAKVRSAADDLAFSEAIEELFAEHGGSDALRAEVLGVVLTRLEVERERVKEAGTREYSGEIEMLQRRINKLNSSLEETEQQLARVAQEKSIDPGISSIYREVQGLSQKDSLFEKKNELMSSIFEANLALQKGKHT
jgi:DNA repair exonuclease SbcCD ATPase subunit